MPRRLKVVFCAIGLWFVFWGFMHVVYLFYPAVVAAVGVVMVLTLSFSLLLVLLDRVVE